LAAARFERCDSRQGGERRFVSDAATVRPANKKLGGDHRTDAGLRKERRPCGVGLDEREQFGIEFADLPGEEPDAGSDGAQGEHGHSMLDARRGRKSKSFDPVELPGQRHAAQPRPEVFGRGHDGALEFIDGLGPACQQCVASLHDQANRFA
jgi:hypothetical protein